MKVVILCGGLGTRISEETKIKPKPMVKIGKMPILEHLIQYYHKYGFNNFILALGYKGEVIKKYFKNKKYKNINIELVQTGKNTLTGGRLLKLKKYLINNENFMLTYGDGLSNINLLKLKKFHEKNNRIATITAVRPPVRFGELILNKKNKVVSFKEKPQASKNWINGGFFVFKNEIFKYLKNNNTILEKEPMQLLSKNGELIAYKHLNFWQCMDTLRDKVLLNKIWMSGKAPWKIY